MVSPVVRARAINGAAWLALAQTDYDRAAVLAQEALALSHDMGDAPGAGWLALTTLACVTMEQGDYREATAVQEEALVLARVLDDSWAVGACLNNLGVFAGAQGDFARASTLLEESVALHRRRGDRRATALSLLSRGTYEYAQGNLTQAQAIWTESLTLNREFGGRVRDEVAFQGIEGLAEIAATHGHARQAARLLAAAEALRTSVGVPRPLHIQSAYAGAVSAARDALDAGAFTAAQAEGAALSLEQAIALALAPA
jgi:non-specific serine/threonine protein kinase